MIKKHVNIVQNRMGQQNMYSLYTPKILTIMNDR